MTLVEVELLTLYVPTYPATPPRYPTPLMPLTLVTFILLTELLTFKLLTRPTSPPIELTSSGHSITNSISLMSNPTLILRVSTNPT